MIQESWSQGRRCLESIGREPRLWSCSRRTTSLERPRTVQRALLSESASSSASRTVRLRRLWRYRRLAFLRECTRSVATITTCNVCYHWRIRFLVRIGLNYPDPWQQHVYIVIKLCRNLGLPIVNRALIILLCTIQLWRWWVAASTIYIELYYGGYFCAAGVVRRVS